MPSSPLSDAAPPLSTGERILAGAAAVVAQHGLRDSTVRHVLAAASISRRTFYLHFPSIEGVMCDLYIQQADLLLDAVTVAVDGLLEPRLRLQAAVDAWVTFQVRAGPLLIHLQTEAVRPGSMLSPVRGRSLDQLVALLSVGLSAPALRLRGLLMGVEGLLIQLEHSGRDPELAAEVRAVAVAMVAQGA